MVRPRTGGCCKLGACLIGALAGLGVKGEDEGVAVGEGGNNREDWVQAAKQEGVNKEFTWRAGVGRGAEMVWGGVCRGLLRCECAA